MNAKEVRKLIRTNNIDALIYLRNNIGQRTEGLNERQIYQKLKKLLKGKPNPLKNRRGE